MSLLFTDAAAASLLARSRHYCEQLTRTQAKNFYYGLKLLPEPKRSAMFTLYAYMRLVDDVYDPAGCLQEAADFHHNHRADGDDVAAGLDPQAGATLHAPVQHGVGGLFEAKLTHADVGREADVFVPRGHRPGRRAHLRIGEGQLSDCVQIHRPSLPRRRGRILPAGVRSAE